MGFLLDKCSFSPLDEEVIAGCRPFSCGNADLDEFFQHDALTFLFSTESQEAENTGFDKDTKLRTRLMYFDLISLVSEPEEE